MSNVFFFFFLFVCVFVISLGDGFSEIKENKWKRRNDFFRDMSNIYTYTPGGPSF